MKKSCLIKILFFTIAITSTCSAMESMDENNLIGIITKQIRSSLEKQNETKLNLSKKEINILQYNIFPVVNVECLNKVAVLNISGNNFENIPHNLLDCFPNLRKLILTGNNISDKEINSFKKLYPSVEILRNDQNESNLKKAYNFTKKRCWLSI